MAGYTETDWKVTLGYCMGLAALLALIVACFRVGSDEWINMLLLIFGGLLGWVTGILATPLDATEKSQFSTYAAAISTFMTGFLVAKLDQLFTIATKGDELPMQALGPALIFGSSVVLGALFTFVGRKYVK